MNLLTGPRKAGRFQKMLAIDSSHSIVTSGSMSLLCATTATTPCFSRTQWYKKSSLKCALKNRLTIYCNRLSLQLPLLSHELRITCLEKRKMQFSGMIYSPVQFGPQKYTPSPQSRDSVIFADALTN